MLSTTTGSHFPWLLFYYIYLSLGRSFQFFFQTMSVQAHIHRILLPKKCQQFLTSLNMEILIPSRSNTRSLSSIYSIRCVSWQFLPVRWWYMNRVSILCCSQKNANFHMSENKSLWWVIHAISWERHTLISFYSHNLRNTIRSMQYWYPSCVLMSQMMTTINIQQSGKFTQPQQCHFSTLTVQRSLKKGNRTHNWHQMCRDYKHLIHTAML